MKPPPILLDDSRRCDGGQTKLGKAVGICIACTRKDGKGEPLIPAVYRMPSGEYDCPNRRSEGV